MIQFNELKITDGKLIIDASVKDLECFQSVTIAGIKIDNQDTFSINGPSDKAFIVPDIEEGRTIHIELDQKAFIGKDFSLENDLFIVYLIAGGAPASNTPCGMDKAWSTGAVANLQKLYNRGLSYIKELSNSCEIPVGFADFILKYKAFVLSLRACDYLQAIKFWKKFFSKDTKIVTKGCGCHGGI